MTPVIGITCSQDQDRWLVTRYYGEAVQAAGGIPVILPVVPEPETLAAYQARLDGLMLTGGGDMDPALFGEEPVRGLGPVDPDRDRFELELCRLFISRQKPILGICRGMQVINVALGGSIYQDLMRQKPDSFEHQQKAPKNRVSHSILVDNACLLQKVFRKNRLRVNSFHHQAVKDLGHGLKATARADDGIIEGLEGETGFVVGVQWHPERLWQEKEEQARLFAAFVGEAQRISVD